MKTITSYKVIYVDDYGMIVEEDTDTEAEAREISINHNNSLIYKIQIIGSIERII